MLDLTTFPVPHWLPERRKALGAAVCVLLVLAALLSIPTPSVRSVAKSGGLPQEQARVGPASFSVTVNTTGELVAERSLTLRSMLRGDRGKLIFLACEGTYVAPGEVIARMDPSPFEDRIVELEGAYREQAAKVTALQQVLEWEQAQSVLELRAGDLEVEAAKLECEKVIDGDGPQERYRLEASLDTVSVEYQNIAAYCEQLGVLADKGYVSAVEIELAQASVKKAKKELENAQHQYDNFVHHVHPMLIGKAEAQYERARLRREELQRSCQYRKEASETAVCQGKEALGSLDLRLQRARLDLAATEVRAPGPGIVVHAESFFNGRRRKPLLGDVLVQNQPIIELPDLRTMLVKSRIREMDLHKLAVGQNCSIRVDALPGVAFAGEVQHIGVLAVSEGGRRGEEKWFDLHVTVLNPDPRLRPGMTARMQIMASEVNEKLCVPVHAVFVEGRDEICYLATAEGFVKTEVSVGLSNETLAVIESGLSSGDIVSLVPPQRS